MSILSSSYWRFSKVVLILSLLGFVAYANSIPHPFVHDDVVFIQNNPALGSWKDILSLFLHSSMTGQAPSIVNPYYRPLLEILYKMEYALFGLNPHGYHFFNVLLHIVNSVLVYRLILLLLKCHSKNLSFPNALVPTLDSLGRNPDRIVGIGNPDVETGFKPVSRPPITPILAFARKHGDGGDNFNFEALALCTAVFFLVHPVQTEAVACIAGVSNLIFAFFCLTSFICYVKARQREAFRYGIFWYALALLLFGAALFSKEQAIMLPLLVGLVEVCLLSFPNASVGNPDVETGLPAPAFVIGGPGKPVSTRPPIKICFGINYKLLRLAGFFILAFGYLSFRNMVAGNSMASILAYKGELILRMLQIPKVLLMFLGTLVFPYDLHYYRSTDILQPYFLSTAMLGIFLGTLIFLIRCLPREDRCWLIFACGWFMAALLPTLNIVPLVNEYSFILTAEHFLYLPMVGFVLFTGWVGNFVVQEIFQKRSSQINALLVSVLGLLCMAATIKQNTYWRGEIPLFERVVQFEKDFGRGHLLLAKAYDVHQEYDRAIAEYHIARRIMQNYLHWAKVPETRKFYLGFIQEIHFDLARCYQGRDKGSSP